MITRVEIKNFKKLTANIELSQTVVFVGPNNSGKTSALQAIALWDLGVRKWIEAKKDSRAKQRRGVPINRKDILSIPIASAKYLWKDLYVQEVTKMDGKLHNKKIKIEIRVEGWTQQKKWNLGVEFDYAGSEVLYCRLLGELNNDLENVLKEERVAFLPPMSGLVSREDKFVPGTIYSRIGEGRTAEVLRNLCWIVYKETENWQKLEEIIKTLFLIRIGEPKFDEVSGVINMTYNEKGKDYELSNAGRGFHQILLLFAFILAGKRTILLIDEPDAHLEVIRQKEVFNLLSKTLKEQNSQLIVASHSEAVLNEAAEKDKIIAFIGKPHVLNNRSQLVKSLANIGYDQYVQAEQKKWVLYLEGSTDLQMLQAFAKVLSHSSEKYLKNPFVKYVTNKPMDARNHFYGLKEAFPGFKGIAIFDRLNKQQLQPNGDLKELSWDRYEIENYIPIPETIERYFLLPSETLFEVRDLNEIKKIMQGEIPPAALNDKEHSWRLETKMSDFLDRIFTKYCQVKKEPIFFNKSDYYRLISLAEPKEIDNEVKEKLDAIHDIAMNSETE
ncbi:MAG: AAA family ATPase [Elusimicrobiota bacterium]